MTTRRNRLKPSHLSSAVLTALMISASGVAVAQDTTNEQPTSSQRAQNIDKVVVTGSLIPQSKIETFQPVTIISAEDITARGFSTVAEVLQESSMATGAVQGAQSSASFTQGAETISLFGLPPSYTKFLIDGRPMANYPALYNGSDTFNNISGIPIDLVERIEILPGGQSSLYGSDALAGVVNIILKKNMDGVSINVRGGTFTEGGGNSFRVGISGGFTAADDRLNVLAGIQYEERDPIWAYDRELTRQFNQNGSSAPIASRDYLVISSPWIQNASYQFLDPNNCANVTGQFDGTSGLAFRPGPQFGDGYYCGSFFTPGYRTLQTGKEATQGYAHFSFDVNDNMQLYGSALLSKEKVNYHVGSGYTWWGSNTASMGWYYYDPDLDDLLSIQRAFSPEDMGPGGFNNTMTEDRTESYAVTFGARGTFGASNWDYDISASRTEYKLEEDSWVRWAEPMDNWFLDNVFGPQLGEYTDPWGELYPIYRPNYAAFYTPMDPAVFASLTGRAVNNSRTWDNFVRAQVTNASLFSLPGGDAGAAFVLEYGREGWEYDPYEGFLNGEVWGQTSTGGSSGTRDRYAAIAELRLPVFEPLTITASGRYDAFDSVSGTLDKPTYSLGIEYRPFESLLLRGKYGTAFRSVSLADEFQSASGSYGFVTDYYNCSQLGFDPANPSSIVGCPANYGNRQIFQTTSGSGDLEPINADVWNVGLVWSPTAKFSVSADYYSWDIRDEIASFAAGATLFTEWRCRTGVEDINSAQCQDAISRITRNSGGAITQVDAPKVNVAMQTTEAVTAALNYQFDTARFGNFRLRSSYTQKLEHERLNFAGDIPIDMLNNPYYSTDPKRKADASLGWNLGKFTTTLYANWIDQTPNYRAEISSNGYAAADAGRLPSWTKLNLSLTYNAFPGLDMSVMVNNLANKMPPFDATYGGNSGAPYNVSNFDVYGRAIYMEMRYNFGGRR